MSGLIDFAGITARNILNAFALLAIIGLAVLLVAAVVIPAWSTIRHLRQRRFRGAVRFATVAAHTAADGDVHGRSGVALEWLLAFVTYRESALRSIPTAYSEKADELVYTTIEAGER